MRHAARPRCSRGHFLPTGAWPGSPCEHATCRPVPADLWGQGIPGRRLHRMTTVPLAGAWL